MSGPKKLDLVPTLKEAIKVAEESAIKYLMREAAATELFVNQDEMFDGFLPITMGINKTFLMGEQELQQIRDFARILSVTDEIVINVIKHYVNHIVGDGISYTLLPKDMGADPTKIADLQDDPKIKVLHDNWEAFCEANDFDERLSDWVKRVHRDGEVFLRLFKQTIDSNGLKPPTLRFIDPYYIQGNQDAYLGVQTAPNDVETILGYRYNAGTSPVIVPVEDVIHDKRNVDFETPRGISSFWAVFTNIRRANKNMVNVSVLTGILSAIALVRKHEQATQSKIDSFLNRTSDGQQRTNAVSGNTQYARNIGPGTVIDAPMGTSYDFPAHTVKTENYINVIDKELAMIAAAFVLPVEWLMSTEPKIALTDGSPVVKNFQKEQATLFCKVEELFWQVQSRMGVDVEAVRPLYCLEFFGPSLATAITLDQARSNEIELRSGALSPQTWCAMKGRNYVNERANMIKYRETAQPGEVMPGDSGNTNVNGDQTSAGQGGDGTTKKGGGQKGGATTSTPKASTKESEDATPAPINVTVAIDNTKPKEDKSLDEIDITFTKDEHGKVTGAKRTKKVKPNGPESTVN